MPNKNYIEFLERDLEKGYSKSDLERLIGLPKNNLSGILKGKKKISRKCELKIDKWEASEKPSPLSVFFVNPNAGNLTDDAKENNIAATEPSGTEVTFELKDEEKPKYNFGDALYLVMENFTKYPAMDKPKNNYEAKRWLAAKAMADHEIKIAWGEHIKNRK